MYAGLGLSAIIFVIHGVVKHGWKTQNHRMSLDWMGLMATLNLIGAFAYAARVGLLLSPWWDGSHNSCIDTGKMVSADVWHIRRKSPDIPRHGYTGRFGPHGRFAESVWSFTHTDFPLRISAGHIFKIDGVEIMFPAIELPCYFRGNSVIKIWNLNLGGHNIIIRRAHTRPQEGRRWARRKNPAAMIQERQCVKGKSDMKNNDTDRTRKCEHLSQSRGRAGESQNL